MSLSELPTNTLFLLHAIRARHAMSPLRQHLQELSQRYSPTELPPITFKNRPKKWSNLVDFEVSNEL